MVGRGFYVTQKHNITCDVSGFTFSLGTMILEFVDTKTVVTDSRGDECIFIIYQGISKPDKEGSLISTFSTRWYGTRVENIPTQHDKRSRFGLIFEHEYLDHTLITFSISGVSAVFNILNPTEEY